MGEETRDETQVYDLVGVGLGPFGLGLAALVDREKEIDAVFFEQKPDFSWHPGLLIDGTTLQVPFLADLVTLADPTSPWSFLNYLHCHGRMYRFYFHENFFVPRREFDAYCRWVAQHLPSCRFSARVESVEHNPEVDLWSLTVREHADEHADGSGAAVGVGQTRQVYARNIALALGSRPVVPDCVTPWLGETVCHTAGYLPAAAALRSAAAITVLGGGQSAAEVVLDLLQDQPDHGAALTWVTRGRGFLPMEYSKLGLEHFSPEYLAYFHGLPPERRDEIRSGQDLLYKGISGVTSAAIFDLMYERSIDGGDPGLALFSGCELVDISPFPGVGTPPFGADVASVSPVPASGVSWELQLLERDQGVTWTHRTGALVLGTGYAPTDPACLAPLQSRIVKDCQGRSQVGRNYQLEVEGIRQARLFVMNAELHTHGIGAPDLGLGAHRNAVIINQLCGREVYPVRHRTVFQQFGAPVPAPDTIDVPLDVDLDVPRDVDLDVPRDVDLDVERGPVVFSDPSDVLNEMSAYQENRAASPAQKVTS